MRNDFETAIRKSIEMDRPKLNLIKTKNKPKVEIQGIRIKQINPGCQYAKFARFIVGRKVEKIRGNPDSSTGWYKFIFDDDRKALNKEAGWSDFKTEYLFEKPTII